MKIIEITEGFPKRKRGKYQEVRKGWVRNKYIQPWRPVWISKIESSVRAMSISNVDHECLPEYGDNSSWRYCTFEDPYNADGIESRTVFLAWVSNNREGLLVKDGEAIFLIPANYGIYPPGYYQFAKFSEKGEQLTEWKTWEEIASEL